MKQILKKIDEKLAEWEEFFKGNMNDEVTELRNLVDLITKKEELPITLDEHWTEPLHTACEWSRNCPRYADGTKVQCPVCGAGTVKKMTQAAGKLWWKSRIEELNKETT